MKTKLLAILHSGKSFQKINRGRTVILVVLFFFQLDVSAQKNVTHQQQLWYGYYNSLTFNEKWSLKSEIQERQFINPSAQHQLLFRTDLEYKLVKNWTALFGGAFFLQSPNDPHSESDLVVPELRPNIGFNNKKKGSSITVYHRYKAEARFFHDVANSELTGGYRFSNFRFRYQLGFDFPVLKKDNKEKITVKLKDEVMFNVGNKIVKNTFDQNRIYLALHYVVNSAISVEAGYMNWFQQQKTGVDYYHRDIIRFSLYHNLIVKNKNHE